MANLNLWSLHRKQLNEGQLQRAILNELRTGEQLERATQERRLRQAHAEAKTHDPKKTAAGLMKPILCVPGREFFRIREQFGEDCWDDRTFIRDYQRNVPDAKIARA